MKSSRILYFLFVGFLTVVMASACGLELENIPEGDDLPENPVERAAVLGLYNSYRESTMWQVREPDVLAVRPVAPTREFVQVHDPKELYCVCIEYEARYKVPWTTADKSPWEKLVRNILVIKTQGDHYLAMRGQSICVPVCQ